MSAGVLDCPRSPSLTGAFQVGWQGAPAGTYRLLERVDGSAWTTRYEGPDQATTVTGQPQGRYEYRLESLEGDPPGFVGSCTAEVAPPSLGMAFGLLGIGFIATVVTAFAILRGARRASDGGTKA